MSELFDSYKKSSILEALCTAAENFLERQKRVLENIKSNPSPFLEDPQAFVEELKVKVEVAQNALKEYQLARSAGDKAHSKPRKITFISLEITAFENSKAVAEFSEKSDLIVGPLFDDPDFKACFEKTWQFLFDVGSTQFKYGDLVKVRPGLEWRANASSRSEYVTHYIYRVKSVFGYGDN